MPDIEIIHRKVPVPDFVIIYRRVYASTDMKEEKTIGQFFKVMREKKSLSIKDVADRLHVHQRHVLAFEEERLSVFSAHVYARGFFEKYATLLQLQKNELAPYFEELWLTQHPLEVKIHSQKESFLKIITTRLVSVIPKNMAGLGVLILVGIVGLYLWYFALSPLHGVSVNWYEPTDRLLTHEYIIIARGIADTRLELTLNKQPVYIGKDGTFESRVFLQKGINELVLEAKNGLGKIQTIERKIVVQ